MLHGNEEGKKAGEGFDFARLTRLSFKYGLMNGKFFV